MQLEYNFLDTVLWVFLVIKSPDISALVGCVGDGGWWQLDVNIIYLSMKHHPSIPTSTTSKRTSKDETLSNDELWCLSWWWWWLKIIYECFLSPSASYSAKACVRKVLYLYSIQLCYFVANVDFICHPLRASLWRVKRGPYHIVLISFSWSVKIKARMKTVITDDPAMSAKFGRIRPSGEVIMERGLPFYSPEGRRRRCRGKGSSVDEFVGYYNS